MSAQITWRNVDAPNLGDALRPLMGAQQSFNSSLDGLARVLVQREATDAANWQTQKNNNTQGFLDSLYAQYKTPEALAAARQSGELDRLAAGFGAQVDRAAIRGAADTRLNTLYEQATRANTFADQQEERELRPELAKVKLMAVNADTAGVAKALEANPRLAQRYGPELVKEGIVSERDLVKFQQGNVKLAEELTNNAFNRQNAAARLGLERERLNLERTRERNNNDRLTAAEKKLAYEQEKAAREAVLKGSPYRNGHLDSTDGVAALQKAIKELPDTPENHRSALFQEAMQVAKEGVLLPSGRLDASGKPIMVRAPLPVDVAIAAISETRNDLLNWGSSRGREAASILRKRLQTMDVDSLKAGLLAGRIDVKELTPPATNSTSTSNDSETPTSSVPMSRFGWVDFPTNPRPDFGKPGNPWDTKRASLPDSIKTGDKVFDEVLASHIQKMTDEGLLPKTDAGKADLSKISERQLKEIKKYIEGSTVGKPISPK